MGVSPGRFPSGMCPRVPGPDCGGRRTLAGIALALVCALVAPCVSASEPGADALVRFDSGPIQDREQAQQALDEVGRARAAYESGHSQRAGACYQRALVSACLENLEKDRRLSEQRYRRVEARARAVLREQRALESAREQADAIEARDARVVSQGDERRRNEKTQVQRERDNREREIEREAAEGGRSEKSAARTRRASDREAELERRRAQAARREEQAPARAAVQAKRLDEHARQQRERESISKRER